MKKIKLKESDLIKVIQKMIVEQTQTQSKYDETQFKEPDPDLIAMYIDKNNPNNQETNIAEFDDEYLDNHE